MASVCESSLANGEEDLPMKAKSLFLVFCLLSALLLVGCYDTEGLFGGSGGGDRSGSELDSGDAEDDDTSAALDDDDSEAQGPVDADGDGSFEDQDCDDDNELVFPGASEVCDDVDNNCDGQIDEDLLASLYRDYDGDGWGTASSETTVCLGEAGWVDISGDCNDSHTGINPGALESCDGLDNDCSGTADDGGVCHCDVEHYPDSMHPYLFCTLMATWYEAAADCIDSGYRLVTFDSQDELTWATETAVSISTENRWWLGFTDEHSEGTWEWEDASTVGFENWCGGEPNNHHGRECVDTTVENCAMLNWGNGGCWNDYPCGCDEMYYICEANSELRPSN